MNEFSIYVLGDADAYFHIFNSISLILQDEYTEIMAGLALMILGIRSGVNFSKANITGGTGGLVLGVTFFAAALYPTTTAHIIDVRQNGATKTYTKVDNLPFALVFLAYSASAPTVAIVDIFDAAFSVAGTNNATNVGIGRQPELIKSILQISKLHGQNSTYDLSIYKNGFKLYTNECAMSTNNMPVAGLDYFTNSYRDIFEQIDPDELGITASQMLETTFTDGTVTISKCRDLYTYLIGKRSSIEEALFSKLKLSNSDIDWDSNIEEISEGIYNAGFRVSDYASGVGTYSGSLKASMINYALSGALKESISNYRFEIQGISDLTTYNTEKNMVSMMSDGVATISWINKIAPLVIHYSLLFSYGLFLLMIPVALGMGYENSIKIISNYGMGIVALHMGYVAAVIANSIALFYSSEGATEKILSIGNNLTSVSAIPEYNLYASEMGAVSGVLLIMAYTAGSAIIFKGETAAMNGAIGNIAGRFKNDMSNSVQEMADKQAYDINDAHERKAASDFIKQNGFSPAPAGVGDIHHANSIKRSLEEMGGGQGFLNAQENMENFEENYVSGTAVKSTQMSSSTATVGTSMSTETAINSGVVMGSQTAGAAKGMEQALQSNDANTIMNTSRLSTLSQMKDQIAGMGVLSNKFGDNLEGTSKGMTYDSMVTNEADAKLAGRVGNAKGYSEIDNAYDKTVDNAEYGVKSKTATTQAAIKGKGSGNIDDAVAIDETAALIKAGKEKGTTEEQSKLLEDAMEKGIAKGAKNIAEAMSTISGVTTGTQFGKEIGMANKLTENNANSIKNQLLDAKDANGNKMFKESDLADMHNTDGSIKTGADLASWISGKQAGHLSGMHGLAIGDKTVGMALGENSVRVGSIDGSHSVNTEDKKNSGTKIDTANTTTSGTKIDTASTNVSGNRSDFYNDQQNIHNTDPLTRLAMARFDGDIQKASDWAKSAEGAKWMMDPRNELSVAAAETGHQVSDIFGTNAETASIVAGGLAAGGTGLYAYEKLTKDNERYLTYKGHTITGPGEKPIPNHNYGKGEVSQRFRDVKDGLSEMFDNLVGGETSSQSLDSSLENSSKSSNNHQTGKNNNSTSNHNDSFKNDTNIVSNSSADVNTNGKAFKISGMIGSVAAAAHIVRTDGFVAAIDNVANEASASWNQFKSESQNIGMFSAGMNQLMDGMMGEQNRIQARNMEANGNTIGAMQHMAGGIVDQGVNTVASVGNVVASNVQAMAPNTSYAQAFSSNQSWLSNNTPQINGAPEPGWSTQPATFNTMHQSSMDNAQIAQLETGRSEQQATASKANVANNEMASQMEDQTNTLKEISNRLGNGEKNNDTRN
jgi:hypothetical protein